MVAPDIHCESTEASHATTRETSFGVPNRCNAFAFDMALIAFWLVLERSVWVSVARGRMMLTVIDRRPTSLAVTPAAPSKPAFIAT